MLKFKEIVESILQEAKQVGDLYHTTSLIGLKGILHSNTLESARYTGISFSRDKNNYYGEEIFTLIFDGDKLSNNHKLAPFSFHSQDSAFPGRDGNSEETLIPGGTKPFERIKDPNNENEYINGDEICANNRSHILKNVDKYIKGLIVAKHLTDDYDTNDYDPDLPSEEEYFWRRKDFHSHDNLEGVVISGVEYFHKKFPNLPVYFTKQLEDKKYSKHEIIDFL